MIKLIVDDCFAGETIQNVLLIWSVSEKCFIERQLYACFTENRHVEMRLTYTEIAIFQNQQNGIIHDDLSPWISWISNK